jgi:DNA repair exonuclease SbcCD nuclease subunit
MNKFCLVGDVHAVQNELDECWDLICNIMNTCHGWDCKTVVFMGDLFHNFSIINSFVLNMWKDAFDALTEQGIRVIVLKGNHDSPGAGLDTQEHGLRVFKGSNPLLVIIDEPQVIDGVQFIPHYYDNEAFLKAIDPTVKTVYCHAEFKGAQYENGFYTTHGIDVTRLPTQTSFVSGHIHKQQSFNNIWYIGSPRWRGISDANETKGIWVVDHEEDGSIIEKKVFINSQNMGCNPIFLFKDSPSNTKLFFPEKGTIYVDIYGPKDYVEKRNIELSNKGYKIRTFPETQEIKIKESEGFTVAFNKYLDMYVPKNGTDKEVLKKIARENIKWLKNQ